MTPNALHARRLLADLRAAGIVVWPDGNRVAYRAPSGRMTGDLRARILGQKPHLLQLLREERRTSRTSPAVQLALGATPRVPADAVAPTIDRGFDAHERDAMRLALACGRAGAAEVATWIGRKRDTPSWRLTYAAAGVAGPITLPTPLPTLADLLTAIGLEGAVTSAEPSANAASATQHGREADNEEGRPGRWSGGTRG